MKNWKKAFVFFFAFGLVMTSAQAAPVTPVTKVIWHGHAAFEIVTPAGKVLLIDPWLRNPLNPDAQGGKDPVTSLKKVDYILVTHGHFDHVGDSVEIGKTKKARLVTNFELGHAIGDLGFPKDQMGFDTLMNIGGEIKIADGEVTVAMVPALHSSGVTKPDSGEIIYGGNPAGYVVQIKDGPTIYHTGDTAYFSDMKLIGEKFHPDLALMNIGGHFGMEPKMAVEAAHATKAKWVVPHHFKTFPILTQDPREFIDDLRKKGVQGIVLQPGQAIEFEGKKLKSKP